MQNKIINPFNQKYWDEMYAKEEGTIIDGVDNAKIHAKYLKNILKLGEVPVSSLGDFGFGTGDLLREFVKEFKPKKIIAIDPSEEAVNQLQKQKWIKAYTHKIYLKKIETVPDSIFKNPLDLGICSSIFQYIPTKNIGTAFNKLANFCKYLYFSVPTNKDYKYMQEQVDFIDPYAISRTKKFYLKSLSPYFTIISHNLLESKIHIKDSGFVFELFRF